MPKRKWIDADTDRALTEIFKTLVTNKNASAKSLCESIKILKEGNENQVRTLCGEFDVDKSG